MRNVRPSIIAIALSLVLTACSKSEAPEAKGVVALVDGQVRALADSEVKDVCATNFCEPNYIYHASFGGKKPTPPPEQPPAPVPTPTPPPVTNPGGGGNVGSPIAETLDYSRVVMNMTAAWRLAKGSRDIVVAVVDTGVQYDHRDLANNMWVNTAEKFGRAGVDDDRNGYVDDVYGYDFVNNRPNALDDNKHGTHCAGIIGAEQNGIGIIGVTQQVRIMPLKFLSATGAGSTDAAVRAIDYAVANGANVISNSWGGGGRSELLNQAIQRAIDRGIVVVAAAGNEATDIDGSPSYPASYSRVIAVASTDSSDSLSSFSNYGSGSVEIAAPGSNILSTVLNGQWNVLSGTSMATPQVSGAIALAMSVAPGHTVDTYRRAMCESANPILLSRVSCGRLDVEAFLNTVLAL